MDEAELKTAAVAALEEIGTGVVDLRRYTPDASWWWCIGAAWPIGEFAALLAELHRQTESGIAITCSRVIAEGSQVAVEATSHARLRSGGEYNNRYHFMIVFEGGLIAEVREYSDSLHVSQVFSFPIPE